MNKEETDRCVDKLLELEPEYLTRDTSHIYYFKDEHLLQAMMENPTFRKNEGKTALSALGRRRKPGRVLERAYFRNQ